MRELDAILDFWRGSRSENVDAVLATVVHVSGSAYRRPGGRMLMIPDGRRIGCVSGGCLEGEIVKKAWWFTESGAPVVRLYDTRSEDEAVWEFGLGCNGVVHVMLERINTPAAAAMLDYLDIHRAQRKPVASATVIRTGDCSDIRVGDRLLLDESLTAAGSLSGSAIESQVLLHAAAALREKKSRLAHVGAIDVFVEWIGPPLSLVVFGAGHDAIPLVNFARQLGWDVTVADARSTYARRDRFPGADRVIVLAGGGALPELNIDRDTAVVVMTHNYPLDGLLVPQLLRLRPRYMGLLGPRARAERLFSELGLNQPPFVHAPAGLDAGCDSPEAIALSIVAEIQAETNSRPGGKLKHRREPIHTAAYEVGLSSIEKNPGTVRPEYCEVISGSHA
jgi:xanthine/CO dehydrogenase XdhC/CoxF family maturation factor